MKTQNKLGIVFLFFLFQLLLLPRPILAETQTVGEEGMAYIGNGITVEDAQKVAVNDAHNKALNGMGAFIESSQK
ncbi:MAG: hypothetical protein HQM12_01210 [SAR324 cluster bacterium]|nr:hypothetical protein [SAR324 cluster bacterium]